MSKITLGRWYKFTLESTGKSVRLMCKGYEPLKWKNEAGTTLEGELIDVLKQEFGYEPKHMLPDHTQAYDDDRPED